MPRSARARPGSRSSAASSTTSSAVVRSRCGSTRSSSSTRCRTSPPRTSGRGAPRRRRAAADADKAELAAKQDGEGGQARGASWRLPQDRASVVAEQAEDRKRGNLLRAAGDLLGGLFGSRRSAASKIGSAADRLTRNADGERVDEANGKVARIEQQRRRTRREARRRLVSGRLDWSAAAAAVTTMPVRLERTDVKVTELALAWVPVP